MINIYLTTQNGSYQKVEEIQKGCWINLVSPSQDEIDRIVEWTGIPADFIKDPLDDDERSRIEKEDENVLTIVDIPVERSDEKGIAYYDTIPIGIVATDQYFITVCLEETPILNKFVENRVKNFFTYKKTRFTLQILYAVATYYLKYLRQIDRRTNDIERELHQSTKNKELFSLLSLEKTLVYFMTSLKGNNMVMEKILRLNYLKMYEDDKELLDDVIIEIKQALEMAEVYSNILSGMMDAFASVISNNVNFVMKFLTAVTIVLSFPTMVFSYYGMNVPIPGQHHQYQLYVAVSVAFGLSIVTAFIFWRKKYF